MENIHFNIREGLSQKNRQFKELVDGFYAVDDSSLKDLLLVIRNVCMENGISEILENIDIDDLAEKVEGEADGNLEPSASIYAICASLLLRVKKRLNTLPDKRIDFYYEKILGEKAHCTEGDFAHVIFPNPSEGLSCDLPYGTKFLAGVDDDGNELEFMSVKNANINDVAVKRILTLAMNDCSTLAFSEIPVYSPKEVLDVKELIPYPLFGLTRSGHRFAGSCNARLGYAFTSPILNLKEGYREVTTTFIFDPESVKDSLLNPQSSADVFLKTFANAFKIYMTTEEGWFEVKGYQIESRVLNPDFAANCFSVSFILPESAPSVVCYNSKIHGDCFECKYPIAKFEINSQTSYNPWKTLRILKLLKIKVNVKVHGLRSLDLVNDIGVLSLLNPIQPFGPMPNIGNTFSIASDEFFGKNLTSLDLFGVWRGIPHISDFSDWYRFYPEIPHTKDFKVSVSSISNAVQKPSAYQKPVLSNLFSTVDSQISKKFQISFKDVLGISSARTQYKITLCSPENAFMHQEYSRVLCNSLMGQAIKKIASVPLPNNPYTPELENIYVDYTAECDMNTRRNGVDEDSGEIFYLHPWGLSTKSQMLEDGGALFIGISYTEFPKSVNLYFHLKHDSEFVVSDDVGDFSWSVLCGENWVNLPVENILYNSTAGFTASGIVSLILPKDLTRDGKMMPKNLAWIRVRPLGNWRHCSRLFSVYAQAVEVKRCVCENSFKQLDCIKPGTIKELSKSREGLSEVCQIADSFGGKPPENKDKMRTRVAEYLYHRGRALSARDYERMILEEFPEVYMVKCFPGLNPVGKGVLTPGYLTVVPVSPLIEANGNSWDPCLGGTVLSDIKNFLKEKISASANVRVVNPFFEKLQVRCIVDLYDGYGEGESMLDLNDKINQFISPWSSVGQTKFFGWSLDENELKSFILNLEYVKYIKELSVLKIASNDSCNFIVDNVEQEKNGVLQGLCPWSVPTPMAKHFLNIVSEIDDSMHICVGYGNLEIGSTFIVQGGRNEEK